MNDIKVLSETAKALGIGALLPTVYNDLLSPAARELGDGLATIAKAVKISLAPVEATVWGYEKIKEWLCIRVTSLLAERQAKEIHPPPLSIAGPLVIQMLFTSEEPDLRDMYAKLLATSMDGATSDDAHPSFITLIQQLTPNEARILRHLALSDKKYPSWYGEQDGDELQSAMRQMCAAAQVKDAVKSDIYVENFLRLRIFRHVTSSETEFYESSRESYYEGSGGTVKTHNYEFIELTSYGRALLEACVIDKTA